MDKYSIKGSQSRDEFKFWHKQKRGQYYGGDFDFWLVEKVVYKGKAYGGIAAIVDFKMENDKLTFAEVMAYEDLLSNGYKVFIVRSNIQKRKNGLIDKKNSFTTFTIEKYISGNWKPDDVPVKTEIVLRNGSENDYWKWEDNIRLEFRKEFVSSLS